MYMNNLLSSPFFQSSTDPTKLSNTIKGLIITSSSVITLFAAYFLHTTVTSNQIALYADTAAQTVSAMGIAFGAIHTFYGLTMKAIRLVVSSYQTYKSSQTV